MGQNKKEEKKSSIFQWAYWNKKQRQNEYEEICEKYKIDREDWTIKKRFDLLENYITNRYIVCNSCGLIWYYADYDEEKGTYPTAIAKGYSGVGPNSPDSKAKFALFSLGIKVHGEGILFCLFEKNEKGKTQPWKFKQFISSSESSEWRDILVDIQKNSEPTLERLGLGKTELQNIDVTETTFNIDHVKKEGHLDRYLPKKVSELIEIAKEMSHEEVKSRIVDTINYFIEILVYDNIKLLETKEILYSWSISDLREYLNGDYVSRIPVNLICPFRIQGKVYASMVINITAEHKQPLLTTIFDLKMAYQGAKLFDQEFSSDWLSIENVRKRFREK